MFEDGKYWELILNCGPWIRKCCLRYTKEYIDDLYHVVLMNCREHIHTFDPDRGAFSTWATWRVRNVSSRYLGTQGVIYTPIKPRYPVLERKELQDIGYEESDEVWWLTPEVISQVRELVSGMPEKWRQVYELRCEGLLLHEIGKKMGLTRQRVQQIEGYIRKEICQAFAGKSS